MDTIRLPLSFSRKGGSANKLTDGSREYYDQIIGSIAKIEPGSLRLDPGFGTADPAFSDGEPVGFRATITAYWPEIQVKTVSFGDAKQTGDKTINVDYEVA